MRIFKIVFFTIAVGIASISSGFSQSKVVVDEVIKTNDGTKTYIITKRLAIQPPNASQSTTFTATASTSYVFKMANPNAQYLVSAESQNYVRTETILQRGVTNENQIAGLDAYGKSVNYQYFDGITRPIQEVSVKESPLQKDAVQPIAYDVNGRQSLQYLPYAANTQDGSFHPNAISVQNPEQGAFYTSSPKVSADGRPFTQGFYENSPLSRLQQIQGAGDLWNGAGKKGQISNEVNTTPVEKWEINASGLPISNSTYSPNSIFINIGIDEDNNSTSSYTDLRGLVVKSVRNSLTTFYVYDDLGNLRFVIPPKLASILTPTQADIDNYATQYLYDSRQRIIKEKSPGPDNDWVFTIYDQWDRPVLTQDGLQRSKPTKEWSFIKYDAFNRPIITGVLQNNNTYDQMLLTITGSHHEDRTPTSLGYTLTSSSPSVAETNVLTVQYYDDYNFISYPGWDAEGNNYAPQAGLAYITSVKTLETGSKIRLLGQTQWLNSVTYYDNNYQEIQTIEEHHLGGTDKYFNTYAFPGWVTQSKRVHTSSIASAIVVEDYVYDHAGRLLRTFHQVDGNPPVMLSSNKYNELGQLVETNLHSTDNGATFLQSVDYRYNIRGWLTHINNAKLNVDANNDDTNDLFGMQLTYNQEAVNVNGTATAPRYNGTITAAKWKTDNKIDIPKERVFGYDYNDKNWIQKGNYAAFNGTNYTDEAGYYNLENVTYDVNGNIQTLQRYGKAGATRALIDNLTYGYSTNGNQLTNVEDAGSTAGFVNGTVGLTTEYAYDKNANLKYDLNNSITSVTYNYINLPQQVVIDAPGTANDYTIDYTYDATGYEVRKVVKQGSTIINQIDYVNGIQYVNGQLGYIFTSLGRANKNGSNYEYEYFLKDHLGNTRLAFGMLHEVKPYKATMEPGNAAQEEADFLNVAARRSPPLNKTKPSATAPSPANAALVKAHPISLNNAMGPAKLLKVKAGEKVDMQTFAISISGIGGNPTVIAGMAGIVANSFGIVNGGETQSIYQAFQNLLPVVAISSATVPKAYIAYILFNSTHTAAQFGLSSLTNAGFNQWQKLAVNITVPFDGDMYIYTANESTVSECYFDEVQIVHDKLNSSLQVTASADYDPFGYLIDGTRYVNTARLANNYLYQGNYSEFDEVTGWNRFALRGNYDSRLGRWHSADPYNQYASPFVGMGNNPVAGVDPDGGAFIDIFRNLQGQEKWFETAAEAKKDGFTELVAKDLEGVVVQSTMLKDADHWKFPGESGLMIQPNYPNFGPSANIESRIGSFSGGGISSVYQSPKISFDAEISMPPPPSLGPGGGEVAEAVRAGRNIVGGYILTGMLTVGLPELAAGKILGAGMFAFRAARVARAAKTGLTNPQLVQKSATLAERAIGGTGGVAGTAKHQYANALLNRYQSIYGSRGLSTNVYFNNGVGNRGFLDVLDRTNGIIYDFKFGNAVMSPAQFGKYSRNFGLPIQVIRP
jgi:RHS repeat-associated protein